MSIGRSERLRRATTRALACCALALAAIAAAHPPAPAYRRQLLWELAAYADIVATGEIVGLDARTFEFRVDQGLLGTRPATRLRVERFEDWTCHGRWADYAVGQRLMVFLRADQKAPGKLRSIGGGNEGELPFVDDSVVVEHTQNYGVRGFEVAEHHPAGERMLGTRVPAAELAAAVLGFREAFAWTPKREVAPRRGMAEIEAFAATSRIARHMFEEATTSLGWTGPTGAPARALDSAGVARIVAGAFPVEPAQRWERPQLERWRSAGVDSWFAEALTSPGDVDGDGRAELLVGAPRDDWTGDSHGAAWLLFLDAARGVRSALELRQHAAGALPPMNRYARFGNAVAALGDLDGNSVPDVAVGAPGWDGVEEGRGGVWLLFLERNGRIARAREIGAHASLSALGLGEDRGFGASLACLGDLGADGTLELAVGQDPRLAFRSQLERAVFVVSLARDGSPLRAQRIDPPGDGPLHSFGFGASLCALGDVDGDGNADLAIADPSDDDGGDDRGAVWVLRLAPDGGVRGRQKISDWEGDFEGRLVDGSNLGRSLAAPGDLDGDDVPDLLVASSEGVWTLLLRRDGSVARGELAQLAPGGADVAPKLGRSLAWLASSSDRERGALAAGGSLGEKRESAALIWWLHVDPEARLRER